MTKLLHGRIPVITVALCLSGCFSYVPAEFETIPIGEEVRLFLNGAGLERLNEVGEDILPDSDEPVVAGTLVARQADQFSLRIPVASRQEGFLQSQIAQQVTLPTSGLVQAERRQLNGIRTGLAVASGTAAIAVLVMTIISGGTPPQPVPPPTGEDARIPLFSVPLPGWRGSP